MTTIPCPRKCGTKNCDDTNILPRLKLQDKLLIWVIGGPGSGRKTQCAMLEEKYGLLQISTGDLVRNEIQSGSKRAETLQKFTDKGRLVPNEIVLQLLRKAIENQSYNYSGFLISSYPRDVDQAYAFENSISPVDAVFYFNVTDQTMIRRLTKKAKSECREINDMPVIKKNIRIFHNNYTAILKNFATKIIDIDADRFVDEVFTDLDGHVGRLIEPKLANIQETTEDGQETFYY